MPSAAVMELIAAQSTKKLPPLIMDPKFAKAVWDKNIAIQEKYNEPGRFTAFIAYEWTSNAGGGDNLHRNVIYRDGKSKAEQVLPMTTFQSENPEDLWKWMAAWEQKTGGKLLAIPHNGNLSNGRMFPLTTFAGDAMTRQWAEDRQRWEPLFEAMQMKGQSESHPSLSTTDEFAVNYELWDRGNLTQTPKKPGMIQYEYLREALKNGLKVEQDLGANPFKYGMAGGTDTHNGLVAAEEDNFFAKFPSAEPNADRWNENAMNFEGRIVKGWEMTAAGYTGVWATGNTREELWDAMKRRETYATSGPHMIVRFFGGFDFTKADISRTPAAVGYAKGVAMGGDLKSAPAGKAPTFLVAALKDATSGNLDRIQIIKGWLDKSGKPQEKIYDVVWGDADRRRIVNGKLTPVGNTVDVATASWTNTIGDPELITVWKDPDFDPSVRAFYYARVLEIPTPRWTAYDAAYFKIKDSGSEGADDDAGARVHVADLVHTVIRRLLREPLLHFALLGAAIFGALSPHRAAGVRCVRDRDYGRSNRLDHRTVQCEPRRTTASRGGAACGSRRLRARRDALSGRPRPGSRSGRSRRP